MSDEKHYGRVTIYDRFKGYGFIRREKGKDVFFFYEEVIGDDRDLFEGDRVSFSIDIAPKGPRAKGVRKEG
ncbi:retron Se72 family effector protein [Microbulbifer sp. TRSA002]|uniref:retron Se72 family effector protein n=1 Tax=Microbulbifer sp. TRSA002 TaxID=3243382 RepID=UPI00403A5D3C